MSPTIFPKIKQIISIFQLPPDANALNPPINVQFANLVKSQCVKYIITPVKIPVISPLNHKLPFTFTHNQMMVHPIKIPAILLHSDLIKPFLPQPAE